MRTVRLAYLVTHPIQYQAPLLRRIAAEPDIDLTVLFGDDFSLSAHVDRDFGRAIAWDVRLLDGYRHRFLEPARPRTAGRRPAFWWPRSRNLGTALREGGFDALWVHGYSHADHLKALAIGRRLGLRTLLRDDATDTNRRRSFFRRLAKRTAFLAIDRFIDRYLAVGSANARHWGTMGVATEKIVVMPYAVDNARFARDADAAGAASVRRDLGIGAKQPLILFAAKMIPLKRPFDVLEAVASLQRQTSLAPALVLAGDGALMSDLQQAIRRLGLRDTHLAGFCSQTELARLYGAADVLVLASEGETWGLVLNEAMAAGCAVVASDRVGAAPDLVRDNGLVYPVGDVPALAEALRTVIEDRGRLERMQQRSREIVAQWSFDSDVVALRRALGLPVGTDSR